MREYAVSEVIIYEKISSISFWSSCKNGQTSIISAWTFAMCINFDYKWLKYGKIDSTLIICGSSLREKMTKPDKNNWAVTYDWNSDKKGQISTKYIWNKTKNGWNFSYI